MQNTTAKNSKYIITDKILFFLASIGILELMVEQWLHIYAWAPVKIKLLTMAFYVAIIILAFERWKPILIILAVISPLIISLNIFVAFEWGKIVIQSLIQGENIHFYKLSLLASISSLLQISIVITGILGAIMWWKESRQLR